MGSRSTPLHMAARAGNLIAVEALLSHVCLDWLDRWNRTALHWAVFHGHLEVCKALIDAGATVTGTVGERKGRFVFAPTTCGIIPQRVSKQFETFVSPVELAR